MKPKTKIPLPPAPRDVEKKKRAERIEEPAEQKIEQKLINIKNVMDYIKANELHLDEIEKRLSDFIKSDDLRELGGLKEDLKEVKDKLEKIEESPIVPPLHSVSKKNRDKIVTRLDRLEKGIDGLQEQMKTEKRETLDVRAQITGFFEKAKDTEKEIYRRLEKLTEKMNETLERANEQQEEFDTEIKEARRDSEQVKIINEKIEKLDRENMPREIESLKEKIRWVEQIIERIDITPLYEKIQEIEHKLSVLRASSPYVIE